MEIDKLIKWVWLVIGSIILITLVVSIASFLFSLLPGSSESEGSGVPMNNLQKESQEKISLGLRYDYPRVVGDSGIYIIAVSIDYSDVDKRLRGSMDSYEKDFDVQKPSNIIFTDRHFVPIRRLLDQKGLIVDYDYPGDEDYAEFDFESGIPLKRKRQDAKQNHIAYRIALADTDGDGQISNKDATDVYVSDLDGGNLLKITSGWVIDEYKFIEDFSTLLIGFYESGDVEEEILKFASYSIADKKLTILDPLGKEIEETRRILKQ